MYKVQIHYTQVRMEILETDDFSSLACNSLLVLVAYFFLFKLKIYVNFFSFSPKAKESLQNI